MRIRFLQIAMRLSLVALLFPLISCGSMSPLSRVVRTEAELSESQRDEPRNALCPAIYESHRNLCYTSSQLESSDPIGLLHSRFLNARSHVVDCQPSDANAIALCTYGFLFSCELAEVLESYGYKRDAALIFQLQEILSGELSDHLKEIFPPGTLYPEKYDPRDRQQFELVLRKAIETLKRNDAYWRDDW